MKKGPERLVGLYRGLCHYPVILGHYFINHDISYLVFNHPGFHRRLTLGLTKISLQGAARAVPADGPVFSEVCTSTFGR